MLKCVFVPFLRCSFLWSPECWIFLLSTVLEFRWWQRWGNENMRMEGDEIFFIFFMDLQMAEDFLSTEHKKKRVFNIHVSAEIYYQSRYRFNIILYIFFVSSFLRSDVAWWLLVRKHRKMKKARVSKVLMAGPLSILTIYNLWKLWKRHKTSQWRES